MKRECAIIVMDSTPLIDLARIGQLDLFLAFDLPIFVADEVYYECIDKYRDIHGAQPEDARLIKEWVSANSKMVHVVETQLGQTLAAARRAGTYKDAPNYGEMAAAQVYDQRRELNEKSRAPTLAPVLLIYDDADVPALHFGSKDVHVLSTYGVLVALERHGSISSADVLWSHIPEKQRGLEASDKKNLEPRDESQRGDTTYQVGKGVRHRS